MHAITLRVGTVNRTHNKFIYQKNIKISTSIFLALVFFFFAANYGLTVFYETPS